MRTVVRIIAICGLAWTSVSTAAAASQSLDARSLGAARTAIPRCTAAGLSVTPNLSVSSVVSVTVGTIPSGCGGADIQVAVNNGILSSTGSATVPGGGGSVTVVLAAAVALTASETTDVVLTGP